MTKEEMMKEIRFEKDKLLVAYRMLYHWTRDGKHNKKCERMDGIARNIEVRLNDLSLEFIEEFGEHAFMDETEA